MTKEQFEALDLREQLTDELKNEWYYQNIKWGLKINKHQVIFDTQFKFELRYHEKEFAKESRDVVFEGVKYHIEKGEEICEAYVNVVDENGESVNFEYVDGINCFTDEDKYADDPKDILKMILLYIVNCI